MNIIVWIVRVVVILMLVWFASKNADPVSINGIGTSLRAPLALILLAFFGGGLLVGLLSSLVAIFRLKREIKQLNRALQNRTRESASALDASQPVTTTAATASGATATATVATAASGQTLPGRLP
ncbi:MAG: LapA family protein, partial [Aeromicrobium sp.]|nr:LapA family protein [Burkholderiales bacterium]